MRRSGNCMDRFVGKSVRVTVNEEMNVYGKLVEFDQESIVLSHYRVERSSMLAKSLKNMSVKQTKPDEWFSDDDPRDVVLIPRSTIIFIAFDGPSYK